MDLPWVFSALPANSRATAMIFSRAHAGDLLGPGGGIGAVVVEVLRHPFAAKAAVKPVIGAEQVEHRGDQRLRAIGQRDACGRECCGSAPRGGRISRNRPWRRRRNRGNRRRRPRRDRSSRIWLSRSWASAPLARCSQGSTCPPRPSGTRWSRWAPRSGPTPRHRRPSSSRGCWSRPACPSKSSARSMRPGTRWPSRSSSRTSIGMSVYLRAVVLEILGLPVEVEFAQDHMAHGHRQRRIGAGLRVQPDVAELGRLGIVGADDGGLGAAIAHLGVEMRVGRARLRHVRAPQHQEARIVPVGRFRHVGLFAPGLRRLAGGRSQYQS